MQAAARETTPLGPNPYQGLAFFDEADADRFFGRAALTERLWTELYRLQTPPPNQPPPPRLLPVLGPSGSGKSSLARAGLLPELARRPLPGWARVQALVFTPGADPWGALALVLARSATGDVAPVAKTREFAAELRQVNAAGEADGLQRIASALPTHASAPLILVIDQFEELYTQCRDPAARDPFVATLLHAAATPGGRVTVVLTLRSDFLGATSNHPRLNRLIAARNVIVSVMSEAELREAISEPAARAGHPFDDATVNLLIAQSEGREGALPLLQFALTQLWDGLARGAEPADTLRAIGGVGGALAQRAQQLYRELGTPANQRIARRAFLALVSLGEGARDTRRRATLDEIVAAGEDPAQVRRVLEVFARPDQRLLTLRGEPDAGGAVQAEVAHEALIEHWRQLREWLDENREDLRLHRRLAEQARRWDQQGRPVGLLWAPPDLDLLRGLRERAGADLTAVELAFHDAAEHRLRQARRRRRVTVAVVALFAILAGGFGLFAEHQRRQAETARQDAIHQLASTYWANGINQRDDKNDPLKAAHYFMRAAALEADPPASDNAQLAGRFLLGDNAYLAGVFTHQQSVSGATFDADGRRVLTWSDDGTARLWDAATGQALTPPLEACEDCGLGARPSMPTGAGC